MMKTFLLLLLFAQQAAAQAIVATPTSLLTVDVQAPASLSPVLTSPQVASGYTWKYYPDGAVAGIVLPAVTCTGALPSTCAWPMPNFTDGAHSLTLTATNAIGESSKSGPLAFTMTHPVAPPAPINLRIVLVP